MSLAVSTRQRRAPAPHAYEGLVTRTFWIHEEKGFPVRFLLRQTALDAPIYRWRVVSDGRRWMRPGDIEVELTGTPTQLRAFENHWDHTLLLHGWSDY